MKLNFELYAQLLNHRSHSRTSAQSKYAKWLRQYITVTVPGAKIRTDKAGNIYVTKGTPAPYYPAIVSHIDINQHTCPGALPILAGDWIVGIDTESGLQCGLGHDDKAGNLMALQMLQTLPSLKCLFTTDEEIGGVGAHAANLGFFKDCAFVIEPDRNAWAGSELITYSGGVEMASAAFVKAAMPYMKQFTFFESDGIYTDVNVLKSNGLPICAVNVTAGYFDEHSDEERLSITSWENTASFVLALIANLTGTQWAHAAARRAYKTYRTPTPKKAAWYDDELPLPGDYADTPTKGYKCPDCGAEIDDVYEGVAYCSHCMRWDRTYIPM